MLKKLKTFLPVLALLLAAVFAVATGVGNTAAKYVFDGEVGTFALSYKGSDPTLTAEFHDKMNTLLNSSDHSGVYYIKFGTLANSNLGFDWDEDCVATGYGAENPDDIRVFKDGDTFYVLSYDSSSIKVTDLSGMFSGWSRMKGYDMSFLKTTGNVSMYNMCNDNTSLTAITLPGSTISATTLEHTFYNCQSLATITNLTNIDTANATSMKGTFQDTKSLTSLELTHFNTSNVTTLHGMFCGSGVKTLDLTSFDVKKVTDVGWLFNACTSLTTVYATDWHGTFETEPTTTQVLDGMSVNFKGGQGYTWSEDCDHQTTYLRIDRSITHNTPGLFTDKDATAKLNWVLLSGQEFNAAVKTATAGTTTAYNTEDTTVASITFGKYSDYATTFTTYADGTPVDKDKTGTIRLFVKENSADTTKKDVYVLANGSNTIYTNEDCSWMFYYMQEMSAINGMTMLDTSGTKKMSRMFQYCENLQSLDLSSFNTASVDDFSYMFYKLGANAVTFPTEFKTAENATMKYMFSYTSFESLDLRCFDVSKVVNMEDMFSFGELTSLNVSGWDTSKVTDFKAWLDNGYWGTSIDLSSITTPSCVRTAYMFRNCSNLKELDLSSFDTSQVTNMHNMFNNASSLTTIYVGDGWSVDNVIETDRFEMFTGCTALVGSQGSAFATYGVGSPHTLYAHIDGGTANPGYLSEKAATLLAGSDFKSAMQTLLNNNTSVSNVIFGRYNDYAGTVGDWSTSTTYMDADGSIMDIKAFVSGNTVYILSESNAKMYANADCTGMFDLGETGQSIATQLISVDMSGVDTSRVTDMTNMFCDAQGLTTLNVSGWDTGNVTSMRGLFARTALTSLDLRHFDTSRVTDMASVFHESKQLSSLDISTWDTSNALDMHYMFYMCESLTSLNLSHFDTSKVGSQLLDASNYGTMQNMFQGCAGLTSINLSGWDTSHIINMNAMFLDCSSLTELDLSSFDTGKVQEIHGMFKNCSNLETIYVDADLWSTTSVTQGHDMFVGCGSLVGQQGTACSSLYGEGSSETSVTYAHVDQGETNPGYLSEKAPVVLNDDFYYYLYGHISTSEITSLTFGSFSAYSSRFTWEDGIEFDVNKSGSIRAFVSGTDVYVLSESGIQIQFPDDPGGTFSNWTKLTAIYGLEQVDTSLVTNMSFLFNGCTSLISLNLSGFDTSNVTTMKQMFTSCSSLTTLDLSSFDTSNVTNMRSMFNGCSKLETLNLANFNTSIVTDMYGMFYSNSNLKTIYAGNWNTDKVTSSDNMFDCKNIVGGSGTTYIDESISYARIDGGTDNPGYFTDPATLTTAAVLSTASLENADAVLETMQSFAGDGAVTYTVTITPHAGYALPESFILTIGLTDYTVYTTPDELAAEGQMSVKDNPETIFFDAETNTLYISGAIVPATGCTISITAVAVPVPTVVTLDTAAVENMTFSLMEDPQEEGSEAVEETTQQPAAPGEYRISVTAAEGYTLPESFTLTIGETVYTVYTTADESAAEGAMSIKDNPAGIAFDPASGILTLSADLLPEGDCTIYVSASALAVEEESPASALTLDTAGTEHIQFTLEASDAEVPTEYRIFAAAAEGYTLPESFTLTIGETVYTVYTTADELAAEGAKSVKDNPAGIAFDPASGTLTLSADLLPDEVSTLLISAVAVPAEPVEGEDTSSEAESTEGEDTTGETESTEDEDTTGETESTEGENTTGEAETTEDEDTTGETEATEDEDTTGEAETTEGADTSGETETTEDEDTTGETESTEGEETTGESESSGGGDSTEQSTVLTTVISVPSGVWIDAGNAQNMSVWTVDRGSRSYALKLEAASGYCLPEFVELYIGGNYYKILLIEEAADVPDRRNPAGFTYDAVESILYISPTLLSEGVCISVSASATALEQETEEPADTEEAVSDDVTDTPDGEAAEPSEEASAEDPTDGEAEVTDTPAADDPAADDADVAPAAPAEADGEDLTSTPTQTEETTATPPAAEEPAAEAAEAAAQETPADTTSQPEPVPEADPIDTGADPPVSDSA